MTSRNQRQARTEAVANGLLWLLCAIILYTGRAGGLSQSTPGIEPPPVAMAPLLIDNDHSGQA